MANVLPELLARLEMLRDLVSPELQAGLDKFRELPAILEKLAASGGHKPLLVNSKGASVLLACSVRQLWRLLAAKEIPPSCKLGGSDGAFWRVADLEEFVRCGCDMARWKAAAARR